MTSQRVTGLDGIRGVAIGLVLVAHLVGLNGAGLVGVLVFFVLSGYLITRLLLREVDGTGRVDLRQFYLRRALRLLPALVRAARRGGRAVARPRHRYHAPPTRLEAPCRACSTSRTSRSGCS